MGYRARRFVSRNICRNALTVIFSAFKADFRNRKGMTFKEQMASGKVPFFVRFCLQKTIG